MSHAHTIDDLLSDSLVQALMRADGVEADSLKTMLHGVAAKITSNRRARAITPTFVRFGGDRPALPAPAPLKFLTADWRADGEVCFCS